MKVGETRELVIPADEGYGAGGFPAWKMCAMRTLASGVSLLLRARQTAPPPPQPKFYSPAGATLCFTLECLAVK